MYKNLRLNLGAFAILAMSVTFFSSSAVAQGRALAKVDIDKDTKIVLTIISEDKKIKLTLADIKALPQKTFFSKSPWYPGRLKMQGPLLRDLISKYQLKGEVISALGLDDYKTKIPVSDSFEYDIILAHSANDFQLTVKTKGPLWVAYPFDDRPELQAYKHYERSIWQLKTLTFK